MYLPVAETISRNKFQEKIHIMPELAQSKQNNEFICGIKIDV